MRALVTLGVLAGCARDVARPRDAPVQAQAQRPDPSWAPRTTTSPAAPFFGIAGISQRTVSTSTPDEFGSTATSRIELIRGGQVVCELAGDRWSAHEDHVSSTRSEIRLRSRDPLRFSVHIQADRQVTNGNACIGYELPADAMCRKLFARSCTAGACTLSSTVTRHPGTGKVAGIVVEAREPVVGATLTIGASAAISDEHGRFDLTAAAGKQPLTVYYNDEAYPMPDALAVGDKEDLVVEISIRCPCCDP